MTAAVYAFDFTYARDEIKEGNRAARRILFKRGHPRLIQAIQCSLLLPLAAMFGFGFAPYEIGRLTFDTKMSISAICFFAMIAGVFAERITRQIIFRAMLRPHRQAFAAPRAVRLDETGALEIVNGRRLGVDWSNQPAILRGRTLLLVLTPGGEWVGVPLRLCPDGGTQLERDISGWCTSP